MDWGQKPLIVLREKKEKNKACILATHQDVLIFSLLKDIKNDYNQFHNIFRLLDILPNSPFTTSEMMGDYYL